MELKRILRGNLRNIMALGIFNAACFLEALKSSFPPLPLPQLEAKAFVFSKSCFRVILGFEVFLVTSENTVELKNV